jgi:hypothetical protein
MTATDSAGQANGFLASEERFQFIKELQTRNAVIPLVGDLSGPHTLRSVAEYLRLHGATVSTFYVSNVEQSLQDTGRWRDFCLNVATLPLAPRSVFVRAVGRSFSLQVHDMATDLESCR